MAHTTIRRTALTDDDGSGHGTLINAAFFHEMYDQVDEVIAAAIDASQRKDDPAPLPISAAVVSAGLLVAGSTRQVSRRSLLGFGWLRRDRG